MLIPLEPTRSPLLHPSWKKRHILAQRRRDLVKRQHRDLVKQDRAHSTPLYFTPLHSVLSHRLWLPDTSLQKSLFLCSGLVGPLTLTLHHATTKSCCKFGIMLPIYHRVHTLGPEDPAAAVTAAGRKGRWNSLFLWQVGDWGSESSGILTGHCVYCAEESQRQGRKLFPDFF